MGKTSLGEVVPFLKTLSASHRQCLSDTRDNVLGMIGWGILEDSPPPPLDRSSRENL